MIFLWLTLINWMCIAFVGVHTIFVEIKGNVTGINGENGTKIVCSYTKQNIKSIVSVSFLAFNRSSITFNEIATYNPNSYSYITDNGRYLEERITLMNITQSTTEAVLTFNKLVCIDDTFYQCKVAYFSSSGLENRISNKTSISVQVPPSKPDHVSIVHIPADSSFTSTKNMVYSSSLPSTGVTSTSKETLSTMQIEKQNETTAFNDSTLPKTVYHTTSSIPSNDDFSSDIRYGTTTYSTQQTTTEQVIAEGDTITVICAGDVGKPPANHTFQKLLFGKIVPMQETVTASSTSNISANCSFYRISNLTFQVTDKDNNAVIRCVVSSSMTEPDMYVETKPIEVYYAVRTPTIFRYPNKTDYVLGEDTSIHLNCKSDGNPKPYYYWYKENPKEQVGSNENFTITNMNITNSGTYTCVANNSFHGDTYQKAANVKVMIINEADKSTPSTSSSGGNKTKVTGIVIAIVVVLGVVIAVIYILYRRNIKIEDYKPVDNMESNTDQIEYQKAKRGVPSTNSTKKTTGYEDVDLDNTDMKFKPLSNEETIAKVKQDNDEYLKKQKEDEDKEKDNPTTPPQAAVYACVNKPKFTVTIENNTTAGQQEEDLYEESKEGIYDTSGDRRHKENITAENYNSTENLKNEESDHDEQKSQVGAYINKAFENDSGNKEEKRQVATVSPTVRLSFGYQGDGQKNKSNEIQPKNTNQPVKPKGQTGSTEKQSNQETSL